MHSRIRDSKPYLDRWIDQEGLDSSNLSRIMDGIEFSLQEGRLAPNPMQQPEFYVPGLTADPWWDETKFGWIPNFEASFAEIIAEFEAIGGFCAENLVNHPAKLADRGRWASYYFYYIGRGYLDHLNECAATAKALATVPGSSECGMGYFSIMDPHTHVQSHCGFMNTHLRCHLALRVPAACRMRVGNRIRQWEEGKVFVFDDSFRHEVWNDSDDPRAVLLFDTWHPDLTEIEIAALSYMVSVWRKFTYMDMLEASVAGDHD